MKQGVLDESVVRWMFWLLFLVAAVALVVFLFYRLRT